MEAKFIQNKELMLLLQSTKDQTLVESSYDSIWGTGIPLKDPDCLDQTKWKNTGILGKILMEIRSQYRTQMGAILDQDTKPSSSK